MSFDFSLDPNDQVALPFQQDAFQQDAFQQDALQQGIGETPFQAFMGGIQNGDLSGFDNALAEPLTQEGQMWDEKFMLLQQACADNTLQPFNQLASAEDPGEVYETLTPHTPDMFNHNFEQTVQPPSGFDVALNGTNLDSSLVSPFGLPKEWNVEDLVNLDKDDLFADGCLQNAQANIPSQPQQSLEISVEQPVNTPQQVSEMLVLSTGLPTPDTQATPMSEQIDPDLALPTGMPTIETQVASIAPHIPQDLILPTGIPVVDDQVTSVTQEQMPQDLILPTGIPTVNDQATTPVTQQQQMAQDLILPTGIPSTQVQITPMMQQTPQDLVLPTGIATVDTQVAPMTQCTQDLILPTGIPTTNDQVTSIAFHQQAPMSTEPAPGCEDVFLAKIKAATERLSTRPDPAPTEKPVAQKPKKKQAPKPKKTLAQPQPQLQLPQPITPQPIVPQAIQNQDPMQKQAALENHSRQVQVALQNQAVLQRKIELQAKALLYRQKAMQEQAALNSQQLQANAFGVNQLAPQTPQRPQTPKTPKTPKVSQETPTSPKTPTAKSPARKRRAKKQASSPPAQPVRIAPAPLALAPLAPMVQAGQLQSPIVIADEAVPASKQPAPIAKQSTPATKQPTAITKERVASAGTLAALASHPTAPISKELAASGRITESRADQIHMMQDIIPRVLAGHFTQRKEDIDDQTNSTNPTPAAISNLAPATLPINKQNPAKNINATPG
ncbi:hypothetical protein BGZ63DRAFT_457312 [Mariannaea sp. PMI_226]|nr:hypothetical protein BGZ63DRAFT_457312 [Mariannaea sp. PMI_226]